MNQPNGIEPFFEPLESLQRLLSRFDDRGVIIGGAAVSVLGKARYTEDLDAMFLLSTQDIPRLLEAAKEEGIEPRIANAVKFAKKSRVMLLKHVISNTNIDISLEFSLLSKRLSNAVWYIKLTQLCSFDYPRLKT